MDVEWYLFIEEQEYGPYSWEELLSFVDTGALQPQDLLWAEGLDDWTEAERVEGLFYENLPEVYDQAEMDPLVASVPVPLSPAAEYNVARSSPLPIILLILAFFLLAGGALTYLFDLQGRGTAQESDLVELGEAMLYSSDEALATPLASSPTGSPLYSMGPGVVPAAFSRTTPSGSTA